MDFFEHQDAARRNTSRLILLFALAVLGIAGMIYGVVIALLVFQLEAPVDSLWEPRIFLGCLGAVLGFVTVGSLWKMHALGKGGSVIAERLGGRRLGPGSADPLERRILNVVEEMAIASGTPVPPVYLLDGEGGINAFAAGHDPGDAVIGVTRGAVEKLSRDELQGVVAHEFSHVLHGDMGLNLKLIGVIHGIELIGLVGRALLRGSSGRRRGKKGDGGVLVGVALVLIGALGSFCGKLIRSAVSRQREFLADASAVQYTRNPAGISGALQKIGGLAAGSRLDHPRRAEMSHMFFGAGMGSWNVSHLFETHPPLEERIRRVNPSFDGSFASVSPDFVASWVGDEGAMALGGSVAAEPVGAEMLAGALAASGTGSGEVRAGPPSGSRGALTGVPGAGGPGVPRAREGSRAPAHLLDRLGAPGPEHLEHARALVAALPAALREASHELEGARALVYALFASAEPEVREAQRSAIALAEGPALAARMDALAEPLAGLDPRARLPLVEMAAGTLAGLEPDAYQTFRAAVHAVVEADQEISLGEWVLAGLLLRGLDRRFGRVRSARSRYSRLSGLEGEVRLLLSALAHAGHADEEAAGRAFSEAVLGLDLAALELLPRGHCAPRALEATLLMLAELVPEQKRRLLAACATSVAADREVTVDEAELFRVVADWLECPAPPLLPGQTLA